MFLVPPFPVPAKVPEPRVSDTQAFDCAMCGHCCEGKGGIVLGPKDLTRIAAHFDLSEEDFAARYAELHNGKLKIKNGPDGFCIFFKAGKGCGVHIAKPDVCRAWPFFRGNIIDPESFALAKDYCPGINPEASHEAFAAEGRRLLTEDGLLAQDSCKCGHALILCSINNSDNNKSAENKPIRSAEELSLRTTPPIDAPLTGKPA